MLVLCGSRKAGAPRHIAALFLMFAELAAQFAACQTVYAYYYERYAKKLPHVQEHSLLKGFLHVFYVFHQETEHKDRRETPAEEETRAHLFFIVMVDDESDKENRDVCKRLVKLSGVSGKVFAVCRENKAPRHVGGLAHDFGVEQVAEPYEARRERSTDSHVVENAHGVHSSAFHVEIQGKEHSYHASVRRQSGISRASPAVNGFLYGKNHLHGVGKKISRLVEKAMSETCAYDNAEKYVEKQRIELFVGYVLPLVELLHHHISQQ